MSDSSPSAELMEVCCLCLHHGKYIQEEEKESREESYGNHGSYEKYKHKEEVKRRYDSYEDYDYESEEIRQKLAPQGKGPSRKKERRYRSSRFINELYFNRALT